MKKRKPIGIGLVSAAALLGMFIGQLLPEPTDPLYFYIVDWLKAHAGELSPQAYWFIGAWNYYALPSIWYLLLLTAMLYARAKIKRRLILGAGLLTLGVTLYYVWQLSGGAHIFDVSDARIGMWITELSIFAFATLFAAVYVKVRKWRIWT
jgi:hypothetical protein